MLFYRSAGGASGLSLRGTRMVSLSALVAYPLGALTVDLSNTSSAAVVTGYGFILTSLVCTATLVKSSLQRIVGDLPSKLDEYELQLRNRAMNRSYESFCALTLAAIVYAAIARDHGGWVPVTYEQFNGLFWGVFLYTVVIPVTILSWLVDETFVQER